MGNKFPGQLPEVRAPPSMSNGPVLSSSLFTPAQIPWAWLLAVKTAPPPSLATVRSDKQAHEDTTLPSCNVVWDC